MRLFIATSFPDAVLRDLNDRVAKLRPRLPAASWVRPESQHVTFAFLGEQPESLVAQIEPELTSALAAIPRFDARLQASGFFPNHRHARVGWIGLQPESEFQRSAKVVREVVTKNGVTLDNNEFRPHLTLMRIRDRWPPMSIDLFNTSLRDYASETFTVDAITLYSSQLHPKGAIHTPLRKFALA
jgi:2'-5' RNA ligase